MDPCRFFNTPNGCRYGNSCHYSHDSNEIPFCHYFNSLQGCRYGNKCHYQHEKRTQANNYVSILSKINTFPHKYGFDDESSDTQNDDENWKTISFIRPDTDIELKTVSWCKDSGFFEIYPGYWTGEWDYKFNKTNRLKISKEMASGSTSPSLNSVKCNSEMLHFEISQNTKYQKDTCVQLRFDCTLMSKSNKWVFRRFTKEEQEQYEQQMKESEDEYTEPENYFEEQEIEKKSDNYSEEQEIESDSENFDPENYFFSRYGVYSKDDAQPEIVTAAMEGNLSAIKTYIANGMDLDKRQRWTEVQEKYGYDKSWEWFNNSALIVAAQNGYLAIVKQLLLNQADPMLESCWTDDEYHTALKAAQNARYGKDTEKMKKIIAMISVVNELWTKLNPKCHESAHYKETRAFKQKPDRELIEKAINDLSL
eukprot:268452_1